MVLKARGADEASNLRNLGFDALHLCDSVFANQAMLAYGADGVKKAFLVAPSDAVAVAGSSAMNILNVTPQELLETCAGAAHEADAVLPQGATHWTVKGGCRCAKPSSGGLEHEDGWEMAVLPMLTTQC